MHTPEEAKTLWCPMARVAQIGATETGATYNRALVKSHVPVKLADASPDAFELGQQPEPIAATMLKVELQISGAAKCIANECAMWRWGFFIAPPLDAEPGKLVAGVKHRADRGFCGLAGTPVTAS